MCILIDELFGTLSGSQCKIFKSCNLISLIRWVCNILSEICFLSVVKNVGLLALTYVGSRGVVQIAARFIVFFSILGHYEIASTENKTVKKSSFLGVSTTTTFYIPCDCLGYVVFRNHASGNILTGFGFYEPYWLIDCNPFIWSLSVEFWSLTVYFPVEIYISQKKLQSSLLSGYYYRVWAWSASWSHW